MNNYSSADKTAQLVAHAGGRARAGLVVWLLTSAVALSIVGLIIAAPLAQAHVHPQFAASIYKAFSFVCHQIPERSFHIAGHQFAVCSRCMGLYAGLAVAALLYPLARSLRNTEAPRKIWLMLAAVPLLVDFALGYFSIWPNTHLSRFTTGALLGSVAVLYIMPGLIELSSALTRQLNRGTSEVPNPR